MQKNVTVIGLVAILISLSSCSNMPTPAVQISGADQTDTKHDEEECKKLLAALSALSNRESNLVAEQGEQIGSSILENIPIAGDEYGRAGAVLSALSIFLNIFQVNNDELGFVRREKAAVSKSIALKECKAAS